MKIRKTRIVIDTNLWISFLISNKFQALDTLFDQKKIQLLLSRELVEEFIEVAQRPKFKRFFSSDDIEAILGIFDSTGKLIEITSTIKECRDFKDNFLLNLSVDGKAKYLISGDKDLLIMKKIGKTKIITINEFLDLL